MSTRQLVLATAVLGAGLYALLPRRALAVKPGVELAALDLAVMGPALDAAEYAARALGQDVATITSGLEGEHMPGSLHYVGRAIDVRRADRVVLPDGNVRFPDAELARRQRDIIAARLGPDFDVVLEATHVHIEYDPDPRRAFA